MRSTSICAIEEVRAMPMHDPPHPGEHVRCDCLEPLGLTVTKAARILGVSRKALSELVNGRSGISPEMAIRLSKAFGGSPEVWLRMQMNYDLWHAQQKADRLKIARYVPA
jgi:addiction module HigA family antidote